MFIYFFSAICKFMIFLNLQIWWRNAFFFWKHKINVSPYEIYLIIKHFLKLYLNILGIIEHRIDISIVAILWGVHLVIVC